MSRPAIGKKAPTFTLESTAGPFTLGESTRGAVVLYFYPRDNTPGCTQEGTDFAAAFPALRKLGATVLGISPDSLASHQKFKAKMGFPFELLSDPQQTVCRLYDVIQEKSMYGKKYLGVERSTFLIDPRGVLRQEWRKVKVSGHVEAVLSAVKAL